LRAWKWKRPYNTAIIGDLSANSIGKPNSFFARMVALAGRRAKTGMETMQNLRHGHLVETDWLCEHLDESNVRVVDMRGHVHVQTEPDGYQTARYVGAREEHEQGHIPGAVYLDWTHDIVDLRDPVPAQVAGPQKIATVLGQVGIGDDTLVIAYDNHPASQFATRLWWLLRYYGHDNARVLNGGWKKWLAEGRPTSTEAPVHPPAIFTPAQRPEMRATAEEVLSRLQDPATTLIDARDEGQYTGAVRRGKHGGHIPGAIHLPRELLMREDGTFRSEEELQAVITEAGVERGKRNVAYCNGGVAATSVLFTLSMLGYPSWSNYDGSWNEWGNREDLPVETGSPHRCNLPVATTPNRRTSLQRRRAR
jgi:thiosulfate/3-mercaptopyruvate sulfurtransferase